MNKKKITHDLALVGVIVSGMAGMTVFADSTDVVDEINITVPVSCTMSGTGMQSHNAEITNGTYQADIGSTALHAFCNDNEGFAIYAAGHTGDEIGGANSNKLVGTSASGNAAIESGLATSAGNPDVSNWAMKLAISQDSGDTSDTNAFAIDSAPNVALPSEAEQSATNSSFSQYHVVPNEYTKVAHKNSATDMAQTTGGVKLTTTYAAYISRTQPADTYSGQVIYTLVHPSSAEPSQLTPPTSCTTPVPGLTYMQDLTSSNKATILSNMTEDSQYYLADKRDDKTYCVAKLRDGNLWMTQNLDHDIVTDGSVIYDNTTTDLGWNGTGYNTASWTPASATKAANDTTWTSSYTIPESYDPGDLYWNGNESDRTDWRTYSDSCTWNGATELYENCDESLNPINNYTSTTGDSHYHLGNYYNWTAAVAMNDSSNYSVDGTDVNQSICPANWTLPKGDKQDQGPQTSPGSFQYVVERYGWGISSYLMTDPTIWETATKFILSGGYYGSSLGLAYVGFDGDWWSSVVGNSAVAHALYINSLKYITPDYTTGRFMGNTIRCLAR